MANERNIENRIIKQFIKNGRQNYKDALILNELGPVGHFLSAIGMNHDEITEFNIVYANQSISLIAGEIVSQIN